MIEFGIEDGTLVVSDAIEDVVFRMDTGGAVPTAVNPDEFYFPVDAGAEVDTDAVVFQRPLHLYAREQGSLRASFEPGEEGQLPAGTYELEVAAAPMKLYVRIEGRVVVDTVDSRTRIRTPDATRLLVGARSRHEHPAGTVTVPETPAGLMRGLSHLGSALKEHSAERSYPTLRGHPPLIELGDQFDAPEHVTVPDTDISLVVNETYGDAFVTTPLAYYLGATVVPGEDPRLVAAGTEYPLGQEDRLSTSVRQVLEHIFLLDCVVRTEGYYDVHLHERDVVDERLDIDLAALYELPIDERTAAYLDVPMEPVADLIDWHLTADVVPGPANAGMLPFLANDMAFVRDPTEHSPDGEVTQESEPLAEFYRGNETPTGVVRGARGTQQSSPDERSTEDPLPAEERIVKPETSDTPGHIWVGEGYPMGASKPTIESYQRRLEQEQAVTETIDIQVVCNETEMREETENLYGFRDYIEFDIDIAYELDTEELRHLLHQDADLLHYIGHVDENGMKCVDGYLDLRTLEITGVKAFFLNACSSYEQGMELVRAGGTGGLVTTADVGNIMATSIGRTMARLLDYGFDLHGVLDIAKRVHLIGGVYSVVGDAGVTLCQSEAGTPTITEVDTSNQESSDRVAIRYRPYTTRNFNIGSMSLELISEEETQYLVDGSAASLSVPREEFVSHMGGSRSPLILDYELVWTDEVEIGAELD